MVMAVDMVVDMAVVMAVDMDDDMVADTEEDMEIMDVAVIMVDEVIMAKFHSFN